MEEEPKSGLCDEFQFQMCFCGTNRTSDCAELYLIKVPDPEACVSSSAKENTKNLTPLSVFKFYSANSFAALGTTLYSLGGKYETDCGQCFSDKVWTLDRTTQPDGEDWIPGPPMNFARGDPHTMVLDGKLYVLDGLRSNPNHGWMEVFDPSLGKWELLPNPPVDISCFAMISAPVEAKKEIVVAKKIRGVDPTFYSYNVSTGIWSKLGLPKYRLPFHCSPSDFGRAVTVGNILYWASFEERGKGKCHLYAYDLDSKLGFVHGLNTQRILGKQESLMNLCLPGFLHLFDQIFCLFLPSVSVSSCPESNTMYLYCVLLSISPKYEEEQVNLEDGDTDDDTDDDDYDCRNLSNNELLRISIRSIQKYSLGKDFDFLDCLSLRRCALTCRDCGHSTSKKKSKLSNEASVTIKD